jgi:hypothetical protein
LVLLVALGGWLAREQRFLPEIYQIVGLGPLELLDVLIE